MNSHHSQSKSEKLTNFLPPSVNESKSISEPFQIRFYVQQNFAHVYYTEAIQSKDIDLLHKIISLRTFTLSIYIISPKVCCNDIDNQLRLFVTSCHCHNPTTFHNNLDKLPDMLSFSFIYKIKPVEIQLLTLVAEFYPKRLIINLSSAINTCSQLPKQLRSFVRNCNCYRPECPAAFYANNLLDLPQPKMRVTGYPYPVEIKGYNIL